MHVLLRSRCVESVLAHEGASLCYCVDALVPCGCAELCGGMSAATSFFVVASTPPPGGTTPARHGSARGLYTSVSTCYLRLRACRLCVSSGRLVLCLLVCSLRLLPVVVCLHARLAAC